MNSSFQGNKLFIRKCIIMKWNKILYELLSKTLILFHLFVENLLLLREIKYEQ